MANQEKALTVLAANDIPFETLDGADPENKDRRNQLFSLGVRAQYPQFFIVEEDAITSFWGNWDKFEYVNEEGKLVEEFQRAGSNLILPPEAAVTHREETNKAVVAKHADVAINANISSCCLTKH